MNNRHGGVVFGDRLNRRTHRRVDSPIRVIYVSYDGAVEPLGQSQVVAYLELLTANAQIELVSFEKPESNLRAMSTRLADAAIKWAPRRYHATPPVVSTAWDLAQGAITVERICRRSAVDIVHVRSDVPGLMARMSPAARRARLLFDIRGFWADERIDAGIWQPGLLYRVARRHERHLFAAADAIVTLTDASVPQIRQWLGDRATPIHVIPTCTDIDRYAASVARTGGTHAVWSGSISTWYRFDLGLRLARALGRPLVVLTREGAAAEAAVEAAGLRAELPVSIRRVAHADMAAELHARDIGLCLVRPSFSKVASAPTRFAEFLAAGMPVAVTAGVGDLEEIVEQNRVGVVLRSETDEALVGAATALLELARQPDISVRCRDVARERFDVRDGARRYAAIYEQLAEL